MLGPAPIGGWKTEEHILVTEKSANNDLLKGFIMGVVCSAIVILVTKIIMIL